MIKILDGELRNRTNKAIINIRLIASRVKRAGLEDAMQRAGFVVVALDNFRKYVNENYGLPEATDTETNFMHNGETMLITVEALQQTDIIYHMLTKAKRVSYKEEAKQIKLLLLDIIEYLESKLVKQDQNA